MKFISRKMRFLKKIVCIVLSFLQILTPDLVKATAVHNDMNISQPHNFYHKGQLIPSPLTCHPIKADNDGNFRLIFDSKFYEQAFPVILTFKDRPVGIVSYEDKILKMMGFAHTNYIIQGVQHQKSGPTPDSFFAQINGNITIQDGHFSGLTCVHAHKIFLDGSLQANKGLIAHSIEECTISGAVTTPFTALKSKKFKHRGRLQSDNILLQIEEGEDDPSSIVQAAQDIFIQGFQKYYHGGSFRAKRSVLREGFFFINAPGSHTFAGLIDSVKGDYFCDQGRTVAWQRILEVRKTLLEPGSLFNGHYFISQSEDPLSSIEIQACAEVNVAMGAHIQSSNRLIHDGAVSICQDLFELPLWEYFYGLLSPAGLERQKSPTFFQSLQHLEQEIGAYRVSYRPYFNPFSGIYMHAAGTFEFGRTGSVKTTCSNVQYTADQFLYAGYSQSGFSEQDQTLIAANWISCEGFLKAPVLLRFEGSKELVLDGKIESPLTRIHGDKNSINGRMLGSLAIANAYQVMLEGDLDGSSLNVHSNQFYTSPNTVLKLQDLITISGDQIIFRGEGATTRFVCAADHKDFGGRLRVKDRIILTGGTTKAPGQIAVYAPKESIAGTLTSDEFSKLMGEGCLEIKGTIWSGGSIFSHGRTFLEPEGEMKAQNIMNLEGSVHHLMGKLSGTTITIKSPRADDLYYTASTFKELTELRLIFDKGGSLVHDLNIPASLFVKGSEEIVVAANLNVPLLDADTPRLRFQSSQPLTLPYPVQVQGEMIIKAPSVLALKRLYAQFLSINTPGNINLQEPCSGQKGIRLEFGGFFNYPDLGLWTEDLLHIISKNVKLDFTNSLVIPGEIKAQAPSVHISAGTAISAQKGCEFWATDETGIHNHGRILSKGGVVCRGNLFLSPNGDITSSKTIHIDGHFHHLAGRLASSHALIKTNSIQDLHFINDAFKSIDHIHLIFLQGGSIPHPIDLPGFLQMEFLSAQKLINRTTIKADRGIRFIIPGGELMNEKRVEYISGRYIAYPGGDIVTQGLLEVHAAFLNNYLGRIEAGYAWTNLTKKLYSSGTLMIHGTHVNDSRVTEIERCQRSWRETKVFHQETRHKKKKTRMTMTQPVDLSESYPLDISGLHYAGSLATLHHEELSTLFPQRSSSAPLLAQEYHLTHGANLITGTGGTSLFTSRIISLSPALEIKAVPYAINQKHVTESGIREVKTIIPARVDSSGSITLSSSVIRLPAAEIISRSPVPSISIQASQRLEFPEFKIKQNDEPFLQKVKRITYLIRGWHEEGLQTTLLAPGGTVSLGHEQGAIIGINPFIESSIHNIMASSVQCQEQTLNCGFDSQVIHMGINKKKANLVTLISFATGIALMASGVGSCAAGLFFAEEGIAAAMVNAAVTGIGSQAAGSTVHHNGNLKRVAKSMVTNEAFRDLGINVASAGVMYQMGEYFQWAEQPLEFETYVKKGIGQTVAHGVIQSTLGQQDIGQAWKSTAILNTINAISGWAAHKVGQFYTTDGSINFIEHKILHFGIGAISGSLIDQDRVRGALVGGSSAVVAETVADLMPDADVLLQQTQQEGSSYEKAVHRQADVARLVAATTAYLANQDVHTATFSADNAIENNYIISMARKGATLLAESFPEDKGVAKLKEYMDTSPIVTFFEEIEKLTPWGLQEEVLKMILATPPAQAIINFAMGEIPQLVSQKKHLLNTIEKHQTLKREYEQYAFVYDDNPMPQLGGGAWLVHLFYPTTPLEIGLMAAPAVGKSASAAVTAAKTLPKITKQAPKALKATEPTGIKTGTQPLKEPSNLEKSIVETQTTTVIKQNKSKRIRQIAEEDYFYEMINQTVNPFSANQDLPQFTQGTQALLKKINEFKSQLYERKGMSKGASTLNAAQRELKGGQVALAFERGVTYDHITKVHFTQAGLTRHIDKIKHRLSYPYLVDMEREVLQKELSQASKLLDHTKKYVKWN